MERINALIDKLCQQKNEGEGAAQLLSTIQLLQSELLQLQQQKKALSTAKVAVIMPVQQRFVSAPTDTSEEEKPVSLPESSNRVVQETAPQWNTNKEAIQESKPAPVIPQEHQLYAQPHSIPTSSIISPVPDHFPEAPTLVQYQVSKEVHEAISAPKESLNDRLKQEKTELAHVLKETPIKDLRKGIGINDRFTFVSELFRGDEAMYERSIKTINGFNILSEAEYWMNRELKFKLGWNDNKEIVQHFYHLVRRRFS